MTVHIPRCSTLLMLVFLPTSLLLPNYDRPGNTTGTPGTPTLPSILNAGPLTDMSWNPAVTCAAVVTTIEQVLGNKYNLTTGGALYAGGGFRPGIPQWRSLHPPCAAGTPPNATFVELRNVTLAGSIMTIENCAASYDLANGGGPYPNNWHSCDRTRNLFDPVGPMIPVQNCPDCMRGIHANIDRDWNASGEAPPMIGVNAMSQRIDVQGFLYWNPYNLNASWHLFSGWEVHPLTAWRMSGETLPDYYVASKATLTVLPGGLNSSIIYTGSLAGFQGTITLSATVSPGPTVSLSPTSLQLAAAGPGNLATSILTVSAGNALPGVYLLTVTGVSGSLSHADRIALAVTRADFVIAASPNSASLNAGMSATSTITTTSLNGLAATITLAPVSDLPVSLNPSSLSLAPNGQNSSILTISTSSATSPGIYAVSVNATVGPLSHSVIILVSVLVPPPPRGFQPSASPGALSTYEGSIVSSTINVTSVNGFTGNVALTESISPTNGLACNLSPTMVTLGSSASSTLSCQGQTGAFDVLVRATSGNTTETLNVAFTILKLPALQATPTSLTIGAGIVGTSIITVTNYPGPLSLTDTPSPGTGLECLLNTGSLTSTAPALLSCAGSAGNYNVTVTGSSGNQSYTVKATFQVQDFLLAASQTRLVVNPSEAAKATVSVTSANGFNGTISLRQTTSSSLLNCALATTTIPNSSGTSQLQCTGLPGSYSVNVTAASNLLTHVATFSVTVTNFALSTSRQTLIVKQGGYGTSTIAVKSLDGFDGIVTLHTQTDAVALVVGISNTSVTVPIGGSATSTLVVLGSDSLSPGNYTVTVSGTNGPVTRLQNITVALQPTSPAAGPNGGILGLQTIQYIIIAIVATATVAAASLFKRKKDQRHENNPSSLKQDP